MRVFRTLSIATMLFLASPGQAVEVTLELDGPDSLASVLRGASLSVALLTEDDAQPVDFVAAARADYRRLLTGLYAQGYFGAQVSILVDGREASTLAPLDAPNTLDTITLNVVAGPAFSLGQANVAPLPPDTDLPDGFATGAPAQTPVIRSAAQAGVAAWRNEGHALARVANQSIVAYHPDQRLDVTVTLDPGQKLTFGDVTMSGAQDVRENRIREIAGLPEGRVFHPDDIAQAEARLRATGTFESVNIAESETAQGTTLPTQIQVIEMAPRRLGFGAELSTVEGLTLSTFWLHRNLLGGAERFRIGAEVNGIGGTTGGIDYALNLDYGRPATLNKDTTLFVDFDVERIDDPGYRIDQVTGQIGLSKNVRDWLFYDIGVGFITADVSDDLGDRSYTYLTFPLAAQADRRNNTISPNDGWFARLEFTPFANIQGDRFGGRLFGDGRIYRPINDRARLALRTQFGALVGTDAADAPADFLFFSGGGNTVRGQPFQSLSGDPSGTEIGGRGYFGIQAEARYQIRDKIEVVGFYDTGYISSDPFDLNNGEWHAGAGLGLRYETGIGPIRLDVAAPVSGIGGDGLQLYIGIGQAF